MKDFVSKLLGIILEDKQFEVTENLNQNFCELSINVPKEHIARVIGKNGNIIRAIRTLCRVRGIKENLQVVTKLEEAV